MAEAAAPHASATAAATPHAPGYRWSQTKDKVLLSFEITPDVQVTHVDVVITEKDIKALIEGQPARIVGRLHQEVLPDQSTWQLVALEDVAVVDVQLQKVINIEWQFPIQGQHSDGTDMDSQSEFELAKYFESLNDRKSALKHIQAAAAKGNVDAIVQMGKLYHMGEESGYAVQQDFGKAVAHYRRAAEQHSGEAIFLLGTCYQEGLGAPQSHREAIHWFKECISPEQQQWDAALDRARQGMSLHAITALFNLGIIYQSGDSDVSVNFEESVRYWRLAAERNFAPAVFNLGVLYHTGQGVKQDLKLAREMYERANALNPKLPIPRMEDETESSSVSVQLNPGAEQMMDSPRRTTSHSAATSSIAAVEQSTVDTSSVEPRRGPWLLLLCAAVIGAAIFVLRRQK